MALTDILYCPEDDLVVETLANGRISAYCSTYTSTDPEVTPSQISVLTYCEHEDCSSLALEFDISQLDATLMSAFFGVGFFLSLIPIATAWGFKQLFVLLK